MSIVTIWNQGNEETGKTLAVAAIATYMAIQHNYKILIVSTGRKTESLNNCFFEKKKIKRRSEDDYYYLLIGKLKKA